MRSKRTVLIIAALCILAAAGAMAALTGRKPAVPGWSGGDLFFLTAEGEAIPVPPNTACSLSSFAGARTPRGAYIGQPAAGALALYPLAGTCFTVSQASPADALHYRSLASDGAGLVPFLPEIFEAGFCAEITCELFTGPTGLLTRGESKKTTLAWLEGTVVLKVEGGVLTDVTVTVWALD